MENTEVLGRVRGFAAKAHEGQVRKYSGEDFMEHPARVMELCREYTDKVTVLAAALLHDVLEDTDTTEREMLDFLTEAMGTVQARKTLLLVKELTDEYTKEAYPQWNRDKRKYMESERLRRISGDAQTVKYADLIDNIPDMTDKDPEFARRYLQEARVLIDKMIKGNEKLRFRARKTVMHYLKHAAVRRKVQRDLHEDGWEENAG